MFWEFFCLFCSVFQPLSMFWCQTVRSTTMPAVTYLQTVSCWRSSSQAASEVSQMRAYWQSTLWLHTIWERCSTQRDLVHYTLNRLWHFFLDSVNVYEFLWLIVMIYFPSTGPNAISVSLSPMGCYVMVGLASRRILLHPTTDHMVAQVFRLQQPHGGETSIRVSRGTTCTASHESQWTNAHFNTSSSVHL